MKFDEDAAVVIVGLLVMFGMVGYIAYLEHDTYPQSTDDCPPGHVYITTHTPQAGCAPDALARQLTGTEGQ